jgi:hypothetical protein
MKKFSQINETKKLSGKEIEFGKPSSEWTEADKFQALLDLIVDTFDLHIVNNIDKMKKDEIVKNCKWFYDWMKKIPKAN